MADIAVFQDVQSSGVAGTSPTTTLADQAFNTNGTNTITGCSRSGNEITLPIGEYIINIIDWFVMGGVAYPPYIAITDDLNNILDSAVRPEANVSGDAVNIAQTFNLSVASETVIKYRVNIGLSGTASRPAQSHGDEFYQKIIIQKV